MSLTMKVFLFCFVMSSICHCATSHHLRHHNSAEIDSYKRSRNNVFNGNNESDLETNNKIPYSYKKLNTMLNKAILQIILGELRPADLLVLRAFNYTLDDVMAIREHEFKKNKYEASIRRRSSAAHQQNKKIDHDVQSDFDSYNKQAVFDYENAASQAPVKFDYDDVKLVAEDTAHQSFDKAMEPHVVFRIKPDDADFDSSSSDERSEIVGLKAYRTKTIVKSDDEENSAKRHSFQLSSANDKLTIAENDLEGRASTDYENRVPGDQDYYAPHGKFDQSANRAQQRSDDSFVVNATNDETTSAQKGEEYEGLEWIGGDVYRVKPDAMETLLNYDAELTETTSDYDGKDDDVWKQMNGYPTVTDIINDTDDYQRDIESTANETLADNQNLTSYQRFAMAQRQDQGQKAIEDIKMRILALTGRFNATAPQPSQVQKERLTMFTPTCQIPRNTDAEAWTDPLHMNMYFQLNLTLAEQVLAAKLRLFKLPQDSSSRSIISTSSSSTYEEEEEDEKKIRVSVYFYTKSLKKHRAKKRLMDSVVVPLSSQGSHLALDVRQGLRFWKPSVQHNHSNGVNHGLVVQVEDQEGRPLKPSLYIQQPSCEASDQDEKAYQFIPALFVRACTRYIRIINGTVEMYLKCGSTQRH
ncbi:uncharacterized protein LOC106658758 isoform X1 [Trichogramma pretiosum]|uniref:uncharacterized protein LOC106658758 isoform X1 n=1 Tax=Trichogramma pretiosum TaxID=7493 RepID=UPI0006C99967|nr:uncharacterized protein LOC106658758 isoform X1 [Trichogramma pretiosum]